MFISLIGCGKNLRIISLAQLSGELILVNGLLFLFFLSPLLYKCIKSGKISVLSICYEVALIKFVAPEPILNVLYKKDEVTRVIYLHE